MAPSHSFKQRDSESYDSVADSFDKYTDRFTQPVAERVVALADIQPGQRILDIGTGTGIVAIAAGKRAGVTGSVLGIDLSEGLLEKARLKTRKTGLDGVVRYERMDAENLEIESGSFDVVLSLFALLHFPDPLCSLKEMLRVLRPGGRLVVAVGSGAPLTTPEGLLHGFSAVWDMVAECRGKRLRAPDFLNRLVEKHIPKHEEPEQTSLADSSRNHSHAVPALVREAGFAGVQRSWQGYEGVLSTVDEFLEMQQTYSSLARKRLAGASEDQKLAVRREFRFVCDQVLARNGRLVYPYAALFVTGVRPTL